MYRVFTDILRYETINDPKRLWIAKLLGDHKFWNDGYNNWFVESNAIHPISRVVLEIIENSKIWEQFMKIVIHLFQKENIDKTSDWINDRRKAFLIKLTTNSDLFQVAHHTPLRIYPPRLSQEILNWILHDEF